MHKNTIVLVGAKGFWDERERLEDLLDRFELCFSDCLAVAEDHRAAVEAIIVADQRIGIALMEQYPNLVTIARTGTGYDNIDVAAARSRGIILTRTAQLNAEASSEFALGLIFALCKGLTPLHASMLDSKWNRRCTTLFGDMTVGIAGLGTIGRSLAQKLHHLGARRVLGWNRTLRPEIRALTETSRLEFVEDLAAVLMESDAVVVALALCPETKGLIDKKALSLMKDSAFLVNVSRGAVVDEEALAQFVEEERIAGIGLDVFSVEHPGDPFAEPFMRSLQESARAGRNVVLTPHNAGLTQHSIELISRHVARNVVGALKGDLQSIELIP